MSESPASSQEPLTTARFLLDTLLIFTLFALQGAWPAPEVNEPYYLGKSIHYWNPHWAPSDIFLQSSDTHAVFYFTCGWLSLFFSHNAFAWIVRALIWVVQAVGWQRLATSISGRSGFGLLSAALFLFLQQHFSMAGEWAVGAAESKGFAFGLVFYAMGEMIDGRWTRVWPLLGARRRRFMCWSAVGQLSQAVAYGFGKLSANLAAFACDASGTDEAIASQANAAKLAISIAVGAGLFSLGALPPLLMDRGVDAVTLGRARIESMSSSDWAITSTRPVSLAMARSGPCFLSAWFGRHFGRSQGIRFHYVDCAVLHLPQSAS